MGGFTIAFGKIPLSFLIKFKLVINAGAAESLLLVFVTVSSPFTVAAVVVVVIEFLVDVCFEDVVTVTDGVPFVDVDRDTAVEALAAVCNEFDVTVVAVDLLVDLSIALAFDFSVSVVLDD